MSCDRHSYLAVFEIAAAPAFVAVEVLDFGALDAAGLLVVPSNTQKRKENKKKQTLDQEDCQEIKK